MKIYLTLFLLASFLFSNGQDTVEVADNTIKIGSVKEELFYYGFAEGDQLIFSFSELKGKSIKEVEIIELPNSSKFMTFKTDFLGEKIIKINKTGAYKFRFYNSSISNRICQFNIKRIPSSNETKNFNTTVYWKTEYDTTHYTVQERYVIRKDTAIQNITNQVAKIHSSTNANGNKTTFNFALPKNTVSWSYYVGVNQAGQIAFQNATKELSEKAAPLVSKIPGYGPLAALALGSTSYIAQIQKGEDIDFFIVDNQNVNLFASGQQFRYIKKGKVINDFSQMKSPLKGNFHFCLLNDNAVTGVTVTVKVTAITVNTIWGTRTVNKMKIKSRKVAYLEK